MIRMDIRTIVVGGGPVASVIVLTPHSHAEASGIELPIRIGSIEAAAISLGIDNATDARPITHDLLANTIDQLGARLSGVEIVDVKGTTFFAHLLLVDQNGRHIEVDARPSDAIALAVRTKAPIFANEKVLETATLPDFGAIERDEKKHRMDEFHDFVESLSPEDFSL